MAGLRIALGRCGFCGAAATRTAPLVGNPEQPARICRRCVTSFLPRPGELEAARNSAAPRAGSLAALEADVEKDPSDVRARLRLADAYAKRGARQKAAHEYECVAAVYARDGFPLKAVAVYKTILRLDERAEIRSALAEIYESLGLLSDAATEYARAASGFSTRGEVARALVLLRKILEFEPSNVLVRERLAQLDVTDHENLLWLVAHYLDRRDPKRALSRLHLCYRATPRAPDVLALLARTFAALGLDDKAARVRAELEQISANPSSTPDASGDSPITLHLPPPDPSEDPTEQVSATVVLDEFRRAVDERIGRSDYGARLDLGIAYEEMGLLDEAIAEFEIASEDPALTVNARALIGLCLGRAGRFHEAIGAYSEAIRMPDVGDRQKAQLYFELAEILLMQGEEGKARQAFLQSVSLDPATPREYPGKTPLHLRGAREAFAGGGSRDAYAPYDETEDDDATPDRAALERILRVDPDDAETRATLARLLLSGDDRAAAEARPHLEILVEHYRRAKDELRLTVCETRLAKLATTESSPAQAAPACSFCGVPPDARRPPALGKDAVICAECLHEAEAIFERG